MVKCQWQTTISFNSIIIMILNLSCQTAWLFFTIQTAYWFSEFILPGRQSVWEFSQPISQWKSSTKMVYTMVYIWIQTKVTKTGDSHRDPLTSNSSAQCFCSRIRSPLARVSRRLSSITEFIFSTHKASTSPSNRIYFLSSLSVGLLMYRKMELSKPVIPDLTLHWCQTKLRQHELNRVRWYFSVKA